jgi:hypothetical protein
VSAADIHSPDILVADESYLSGRLADRAGLFGGHLIGGAQVAGCGKAADQKTDK